MNIERVWEQNPPLEPMTSMHALWRDFVWRRDDPDSPIRRYSDNIPAWCAEAPTPVVAAHRAVMSIRPNGRMHNHQSKVSPALPRYRRRVVSHLPMLMRSRDFATLHAGFEFLKTSGIGPMTVYDVAVRFGAYLGLKPEAIYVHAGTRAGLEAIGIDVRKKKVIPMNKLPRPISHREPDDVEDFLCTYRSAFEKL